MELKRLLILTMAVSLFGACNKSSESGIQVSPAKQGVGDPVIKGEWRDTCVKWGEGSYLSSSYQIFTFEGGRLIANVFNHSTADCSGDVSNIMKMKFNYELHVRPNGDPSIYDIDTVAKEITYIVYDQDVANLYNTMAYCDYTDWVIGVEKNVANRSCMSGPKIDEPIYSIVKISVEEVQFGNEDDEYTGKTPELRHKILGKSYMRVK